VSNKVDLLVVGEINPDLILQGRDLTPAFGQAEKLVENATLTIGSSSVIFACGAAKLGLKVAFVGIVGDDVFGRYMLDEMQERGIDTASCIISKQETTGFSVILSQPHDRAILTHAGSMANLRYEDIDQDVFKHARHLHLGSFFMLKSLQKDVAKLFSNAKAAGLTTSIDTNYDPLETWDSGFYKVLEHTDVFLPNETEALRITRQETIEAALEKLSDIPTLALKLGGKGGLAKQKDKTVTASPLHVNVVDTTGAGDTFDAGFLYGYLNGWSLEKSLQFACACGSLSTQGIGGTAAQPTLEEALTALENTSGLVANEWENVSTNRSANKM
jgi:sugar/nucleoside kinase (ribokinase family)